MSFTSTLGILPKSWEDSLWRSLVPSKSAELPKVELPAQPVRQSPQSLSLGARGALAVDIDTGTVLFSKDANTSRPIASIVKLATVLLIIRGHSLEETVTVGALPAYPAGAVRLGLQPGQKISVAQLLAATLIPSANDAADALAIYDSGSITAFTAKSKALFEKWGITGIAMADANGLSSASAASPAALAKLAELALTNPHIRRLADMPSAQIADLAGRVYQVTSTNKLLADPAYSGLKTGYTEAAGENVIGLAEIEGHQVVTIVLGSQDRFGETRALVNHLKSAWSWQ